MARTPGSSASKASGFMGNDKGLGVVKPKTSNAVAGSMSTAAVHIVAGVIGHSSV